jgi:HAD superfamily hydrolase (TIGR01549 family)
MARGRNERSSQLVKNLAVFIQRRGFTQSGFGKSFSETLKKNSNLPPAWQTSPSAVRNWVVDGAVPDEPRFTALALFIRHVGELANLKYPFDNNEAAAVESLKEDILSLNPSEFTEKHLKRNSNPSRLQTENAEFQSGTQDGIKVYCDRDSAAKNMLEDLKASKTSCWISAAVYVNNLIRSTEHEVMVSILTNAAERASENSAKYRVTYCSLSSDTSTKSLAGPNNSAIVECWSLREKSDLEHLKSRIRTGSKDFEQLVAVVGNLTKGLVPERRYFRNYLIPHAIVAIDDHIVYVSLYDWQTQTGRQSITLRFSDAFCASRFLKERDVIRRDYSYPEYHVLAFDFDGVVANSMPIQEEAWNFAADTAGASSAARQKLVENFWAGAAGTRMFHDVAINETNKAILRKVKDARFKKLLEKVEPFPRCKSVLKFLKSSGHYKLAIATTASRGRVQEFLTRHSIDVDHIITNDESKPKPAPDMIDHLATRFKCQTWQVCVIGDTSTDYQMSQNAGAGFIHFLSHDKHGVPNECFRVNSWNALAQVFLGQRAKTGVKK